MSESKIKFSGKIIVIGSGNWGTTLALLFSKNNRVHLWTINQEEADLINSRPHSLPIFPEKALPNNIRVEAKFSSPIQPEDIVVIVIPSRKIIDLIDEFIEHDIKECIILNASKGVKHSTLMTVGQNFFSKMPDIQFATLSGPTIANEIIEGLPAKAVLASKNVALLLKLQEILDNDLLKFEFSRDIKGVELAGSMKGLIAIAVGVSDGLGFKTNMMGLIMTYGLREFDTVMQFLGVKSSTVYGIAGMGDLITTCISENSRNRTFGKLLALGHSRDEALQMVGMEVEGVSMAKTIRNLSKFNLSIPLISFITRVIFEDVEDIRSELLETINNISV